jgi:hypothetical protein
VEDWGKEGIGFRVTFRSNGDEDTGVTPGSRKEKTAPDKSSGAVLARFWAMEKPGGSGLQNPVAKDAKGRSH